MTAQCTSFCKGCCPTFLHFAYVDEAKYFAMKVMSKRSIVESGSVEPVLREKHILRTLSHPFVVKLHFAFHDPHYIFFVMNLVRGGDLYRILVARKGKGIPESAAARVDIARAVLRSAARATGAGCPW